MSDPAAGAAGFADSSDRFHRSEELVDAFLGTCRQRAAVDAAEIRLLARAAAFAATPPDADPATVRRHEITRRSLIAELATATRASEWTVTRLMGEASDYCERFATAVTALERGEITRRHLAVIWENGRDLHDDAARDEYVTGALERARHTTAGRLGPIVRVLAERFREQPLHQRHAVARAQRRVELTDLADSMAALTLTDNAVLIHGIYDRLTSQARSVVQARSGATDLGDGTSVGTVAETDTGIAPRDGSPDPDDTHPGHSAGVCDIAVAGDTYAGDSAPDTDTRTMDQLRADILTDLLLTGAPSDCVFGDALASIHATVQITVPVLTVAGHSAEPCLLTGYGPIDPDTARILASSAPGWERVMTSPVTGSVLAVDRYRPGPALQRFLRARDEHCRFPGCRRPVWRCDIDHTIEARNGGPTSHENLAHLRLSRESGGGSVCLRRVYAWSGG